MQKNPKNKSINEKHLDKIDEFWGKAYKPTANTLY